VDLTTYGASGTIGDAYFVQSTTGAGTGNIQPFLRVQRNGAEQGVNSDGPYTMDEKSGPWTHSARVRDFGVTDLNGVPSIRFLLDINENSHEALLSLDQLKIFVAPIGSYNTLGALEANATLIYDMGVGNKILLNFDLEAGSGYSDMSAYLPYERFLPYEDQFLYLFCEFGATGGDYSSDDGFEEWATAGDPPVGGACCFEEDGRCEILSESDCESRGGLFQGSVTTCDPNPCAQPTGACCLPDGACVVMTQDDCMARDGSYYGDGSECEPNSCQTVPTLQRSWGEVKNAFHR